MIAIKAKTNIPVIVMGAQPHAREMVVNAGASVFLDIPAQPQQVADAVAECLGLEPKIVWP